MLIKEKYIILEEIPDNINLSTELCIINYNIVQNFELTQKLIKHNADVTFWVATKDFSKEYVLAAGKLGVKNIIPMPIKTELIDDFFGVKTKYSIENICMQNYPKLDNSNILIVDDNELNVKLLTEVLTDLGVRITACLNPLSSLELIKSEKFDLFLLDVLMPAMSGFELAREIKNTSVNSSAPVVFISAVSGTENILNGYNLGACSYIEKPFHPVIVKSQIYNILKNEENKRETEKDREQFVAALTHDLKSPINAEISALNYLLKKTPEEREVTQNELLTNLLSSAKYMRLITDKILCHYKQKNDKITLHKEKISFNDLIVSSIEELKFLFDEKNIKIRFSSDIFDDMVFADGIEIKRVLNNLLSNAAEYSKKDGVIDIRLDKTKTEFICEVTDYGAGIEIPNVESVFDEYVSLAKQQKKTGFGLGLNICKKIIRSHNGDIKIKSKKSEGTKITFTLPV